MHKQKHIHQDYSLEQKKEKVREMENFPVINLANINGEEKKTTLDQIEDACQNWGFFEVHSSNIYKCVHICKLRFC